MTHCPLTYSDPCSECDQFGTCSPSQAVQKLAILENTVEELKAMIQNLMDKK